RRLRTPGGIVHQQRSRTRRRGDEQGGPGDARGGEAGARPRCPRPGSLRRSTSGVRTATATSNVRAASERPWSGLPRLEELLDRLLLGKRQGEVCVPRVERLAVMQVDRLVERACPAVVEIWSGCPHDPQRRGAELVALRVALHDAIAGPDVVQEQIGVERDG